MNALFLDVAIYCSCAIGGNRLYKGLYWPNLESDHKSFSQESLMGA